MVIAGDDGVDGRILPRSQTLEAQFVFGVGEGGRDIGGGELGSDLADHGLLPFENAVPEGFAGGERVAGFVFEVQAAGG